MEKVKSLYPVFLRLSGRPVLVVGGGNVALRRVEGLLDVGARVTVVSPEVVEGLAGLSAGGRLRWKARAFEPGDEAGQDVVYTATGSRQLARELRRRAHEPRARFLFNAAEDAALADFHVPAVACRQNVKIAVSTGGASPRAAALVRDLLAAWLEEHRGLVDTALAAGRKAAKKPERRNEEEGASGSAEVRRPPVPAASRSVSAESRRPGKVYLVGAGPGDPGLLTVRAAQLLQEADVVYYDRLVGDAVLEKIPAHVERVYVGKEVGNAHRANINVLLATSARAGRTVVRLKGGDPLIFGRAGEEILALRRAGLDYEVVPGVSALSAVSGAAGIPITHRGVASQVVVRSGHALEPARRAPDRGPDGGPEPEGSNPRRDWKGTTYVYFMPTRRLGQIAAELREEGLPADTPAALIERGTLPEQRVYASTLRELPSLATDNKLETPALLIVGVMVKFRDMKEFFAGTP